MEVKLPVDLKLRAEGENKMKKPYKHLAVLGTLCCIAALAVLWMAVLTVDWVSIQEPLVDQLELDKLGPYEEPKPHLIRVKFGLFKMCFQNAQRINHECRDLDWYNVGFINFVPTRKAPEMPTALIANCVQKLKFTLPFIGLSVVFTSASFLCLTFGHFCSKNKKIIEASMLILAGLCQATALLTFVTQIGSEFEANMPYSHHQQKLTSFYRYKYGYSFYLFLLSFSLSELAALFDMAAYFRKFPPNHYVITFHRQEPSPFMATSTTSPPMTLPMSNHQNHHSSYNQNHNHHHSQGGNGRTNFHTLPNNHHNHNHHPQMNSGSLSLNPNKYPQQQLVQQHPDICNDFSSEHIDLTLASRHSLDHGLAYGNGNGNGMGMQMGMGNGNGNISMQMQHQHQLQHPHQIQHGDQCDSEIMPPQSYISPEVTITTIERTTGYGTLRTNPKIPSTATMESFGTMRKENNI